MTVVGFRFRNAAPSDIKKESIITFEKEPQNAVDKNAIKVLVNGTHLGYVSKKENMDLMKYLDDNSWYYTAVL